VRSASSWLAGRRLNSGLRPADPSGVVIIGASIFASLVGWLVDAPVRAVLGPGPSLATSFVVSLVAYIYAKRFLSDLRGQ